MSPRHIDHFAVYRGMLAIDGWSSSGAPSVLYDGVPIISQSYPLKRDDLIPHFGPESSSWGFSTRALVRAFNVEHRGLSLLFPNGERIDAPGNQFEPSNADLDALTGRFRQATERGGRVLEIGSRARSGNTYRHMVAPFLDYVGLDVSPGPNVDVVGDAHHMSRHLAGRFDFAFSISVFEHLLMPWKAALELNKVLRPGGLAFIQSHPTWPLHEEPWDFWRFSENAWEGLFNKHTGFRMLGKAHALPAQIIPTVATGGHLQGHEHAKTFMLSACLVEKIGDPLVSWEAEAGDLYDLAYDHA